MRCSKRLGSPRRTIRPCGEGRDVGIVDQLALPGLLLRNAVGKSH